MLLNSTISYTTRNFAMQSYKKTLERVFENAGNLQKEQKK